MKEYTTDFDFKDKVLIELKCIASTFRIMQSLDIERILNIDLEIFGNMMEKHTEFLYYELEEFFYPSKNKTQKKKKKV